MGQGRSEALSDNSQSSLDDDTLILDIIKLKRSRERSSSTKRKRRATQTKSGSEDHDGATPDLVDQEFDVQLPLVFLTDAKRNEALLKSDKEIRKEMEEISALQMKNKMERRERLQEVIAELNDNGLDLTVFRTEDGDNGTAILSLASGESAKGDGALERHFFFFANTGIAKQKEHASLPPIFLDQTFILQLTQARFETVSRAIFPFLGEFVSHIVHNVHEPVALDKANGLLRYMYLSQRECSRSDVDSETFLSLLSHLGANTKLITEERNCTLVYKYVLINTCCDIIVSKLRLVFHYILTMTTGVSHNTDELSKMLMRSFVLTLLDHNNYSFCYEDLIQFVSLVLPLIYDWRYRKLVQKHSDDAYIIIVQEFADILNSSLRSRDYASAPHSPDAWRFRCRDFLQCYRLLNVLLEGVRRGDLQHGSAHLVISLMLMYALNCSIDTNVLNSRAAIQKNRSVTGWEGLLEILMHIATDLQVFGSSKDHQIPYDLLLCNWVRDCYTLKCIIRLFDSFAFIYGRNSDLLGCANRSRTDSPETRSDTGVVPAAGSRDSPDQLHAFSSSLNILCGDIYAQLEKMSKSKHEDEYVRHLAVGILTEYFQLATHLVNKYRQVLPLVGATDVYE